MFVLSPDETLAVLTAAFLGGALFGRIVWRRKAYDERIRSAADAALQRAEEHFRLVQDASPDGFGLLRRISTGQGADLEFVYLNPAWELFTGCKGESLVGRRVRELGSELSDAPLLRSLESLARGDVPPHDEIAIQTTRERRWVSLTSVRIDDAIAVTLVDVTTRKQAEAMLTASKAELERRVEVRTAELEEARERYRLLAEHASDMISTHALDGTYTYAAPALEELLGQSTEQLRRFSMTDFAADDDKTLIDAARERARRHRGASLVTWRCRRADGSYVWLETSGRAVRDSRTGEAQWFVCASRDVTARKRIEDALRESERRLRATLETSNLVAVALDPDGVITFCNEGLCAVTGWGRDALLGRNWFDLCMPDGALRRVFRAQMRRGTIPSRFEGEIVCRDGTRRLIEWDNNVLRDPTGSLIGTVSLGVDVTEKRQEETALQLLQTVTIAAAAAEDIDTALGAMLQSICEAMHWRYGEAWLLDESQDHIVRQDVAFIAPGLEASALIESGRELRLKRGEGLPGQVWQRGTPDWLPRMDEDLTRPRRRLAVAAGLHAALAVPVMSGREVTGVLVFFLGTVKRRDERAVDVVTSVAKQLGSMILRKRAETELRESEARLRAIVRSLKEGLIITDLEDRIQLVNERTLELTGLSKQQLVGRSAADLFSLTSHADQQSERLGRRRHGFMDRTEVRLALPGQPERWLEITGGPLANADGEIVGSVGTLIDVSDRRQYEAALLRARDAAEAASHAKSDFLSRMSHELRTPLNSVIGFARVLRRHGAGKLEAQDLQYLDRIQANGEHLLKLVNDVLDVAKIEAGRVTVEWGAVRIDAVIREVVDQLEGQPRAAGVALRADVPPSPVMMQTDARLLRQVLINLVGNAIRFTHQGHVVVRLIVEPGTQRPLRIEVADTGIGIPADRQRAIFEPFEQADSTTTRAYGGTGLGLSIARSLCEALGYTLTVESTPGEGSTFSIRLGDDARRTGEAA
jgi:PAS domain S-box-containing protein